VTALRGRVAVVTGAASGIGRAVALGLAARGADLALVDVDAAGLAVVADAVRARGRRASIHAVDVADRERMRALPAEVVAEHGRVELLVNNAGVSVGGTFEEQGLDDLDWIVGINFWGVVYGCKFFLPELRRSAPSHIVNLSSMFGLAGVPGQSSYCATKFAVRGLSEALWVELRDAGVGVTCVHPGGVKTNIVRDSRLLDPAARERLMALFERAATAPEKAAERILRAVERDRQRVVICPEARATDWLKRLAPATTQRLAHAALRRFGAFG
jgi:short-subunit dehydrogenase